MIRQTIFLLLSTLLFTACVENGKTLQPRTHTEFVVKSVKSTETNTSKTTKTIDSNDVESIDTEIIDFSFLNLTDDTKNTLSGIAIVIIGLIILL